MKDLAGRVALITGAGSGIGRGTAMALGARGVRIIAADIDEGIALAARDGGSLCMVIGGAGIYRQTLAQAARIYLTEIDIEPEGDTFFPALDPAEWAETSREEGPADSPSGLRFRFITLDRVGAPATSSR